MEQLANFLSNALQSLFEHIKKNSTAYTVGGATAAAGTAAAGVSYAIGHNKGKKEGTVEQAERDAKKIEDMENKHEADRNNWNQQRKDYEELLDDKIDKIK